MYLYDIKQIVAFERKEAMSLRLASAPVTMLSSFLLTKLTLLVYKRFILILRQSIGYYIFHTQKNRFEKHIHSQNDSATLCAFGHF